MRQFGKEIYDHRKFEFEIATGEAAAGTLLASKLPPPNVNHPDGRVALASAFVLPYLLATHPWRTGGGLLGFSGVYPCSARATPPGPPLPPRRAAARLRLVAPPRAPAGTDATP